MLLALLLSGSLLQAAPEDQAALPPECAKTDTTLEMNDCFAALATLERDRMERYYAAAVERLEADKAEWDGGEDAVIEQLAASQETWRTYVDQACDAVYTRWQAGTIRNLYAIECRRELTRERAHHLWREYLTYPDQTPPLLPEPTAFFVDLPRS